MFNQNFLKAATLLFLASQSWMLTSAIPLQNEAEGSDCNWVGCKSNGVSPVQCISGVVKLCTGTQVCYDIEGGNGNLHCEVPGWTSPNAATPPSTPPVIKPVVSQNPATNGAGWNDKQQHRDGTVSYHSLGGTTACGTEASAFFHKSPYYAAVDPKFFAGFANANNAPVCNQTILLSCE